jgi:hypothetical protein
MIHLSRLIAIILFFFTTQLLAHPGRTDKRGCHTCRTNCYRWGLENGEYHCHNRKNEREMDKDQINLTNWLVETPSKRFLFLNEQLVAFTLEGERSRTPFIESYQKNLQVPNHKIQDLEYSPTVSLILLPEKSAYNYLTINGWEELTFSDIRHETNPRMMKVNGEWVEYEWLPSNQAIGKSGSWRGVTILDEFGELKTFERVRKEENRGKIWKADEGRNRKFNRLMDEGNMLVYLANKGLWVSILAYRIYWIDLKDKKEEVIAAFDYLKSELSDHLWSLRASGNYLENNGWNLELITPGRDRLTFSINDNLYTSKIPLTRNYYWTRESESPEIELITPDGYIQRATRLPIATE